MLIKLQKNGCDTTANWEEKKMCSSFNKTAQENLF